MSNKIVPMIYRAVIDDVISSIKPEFDDFGVGEDVLAELQSKWEAKVIASHVAEFDPPPPAPAAPPPTTYPSHPMMMQYPHHPYPPPPAPTMTPVKTEPLDSRYILGGGVQGVPPGYALPTLPGPPRPQAGMPYAVPTPPPQAPTARTAPAPAASRIPQTDGPSSSSSGSQSPQPAQYAPRSSHPSLPQPTQSSSANEDLEAINSDLDDSNSEGDDDDEEGGSADTDIMFCTYDKVARVKTKWKCTLKDGMIHINGKDYLFAKCAGEFEW